MLSADNRGHYSKWPFPKAINSVYVLKKPIKVYRYLHLPSLMSPILKEQSMYNNSTVNKAYGELLELIKNYVTQHSVNFGRNCYLLNSLMAVISLVVFISGQGNVRTFSRSLKKVENA